MQKLENFIVYVKLYHKNKNNIFSDHKQWHKHSENLCVKHKSCSSSDSMQLLSDIIVLCQAFLTSFIVSDMVGNCQNAFTLLDSEKNLEISQPMDLKKHILGISSIIQNILSTGNPRFQIGLGSHSSSSLKCRV